LAKSPNSSGKSVPQRAVPRYTFVATTEIIDPASTVRLSGRISEISRQGCYVDTLNALPVGTLLNVLISRDQGIFVTRGKIIYVHEQMGMGVLFVDPSNDQLKILDSWLAELQPTTAP
jgi:hypothetical protein